MPALNHAPSKGPGIFVNRADNISTRRTGPGLINSHGGSSDVILRLVDNIIRLLENIGESLTNRSVSDLSSAP